MAPERSARNVEPADAILEALVELARSAIANRREAASRRGKISVIQGGRKSAA